MPIASSVGFNGSNVKPEVQYVQALLNVSRSDQGQALLDLDGRIGPSTITAINEFQAAVGGFADGLVEPGGFTITALEAAITPTLAELGLLTRMALVLSYEPLHEEPQPEEEPGTSDATLMEFVQSIHDDGV